MENLISNLIGNPFVLLGLLARTMLVPLLFLIPQIYNLGNYLAAHTSWGAYLPQPAGELFVATPTSQYANNPLQGLLILSVWLLVIGVMASLRFFEDGFRRTLLMIKALLKSEWIKFRSYYLVLGAAFVALVVVPFFLMNLDYSQTAVGQTKALSEALHALYLAQPVIVIFTSSILPRSLSSLGCERIF